MSTRNPPPPDNPIGGPSVSIPAADDDMLGARDDDLVARFLADTDWRLIQCNPTLLDLLGHGPGDRLADRRLLDYAVDPLALQTLLTRARVERRAGPVDLQLRRTDGVPVDVSCVLSIVRDEQGVATGVRGQLLDVTAQRRLQLQLAGATRMELFGRFAGGLAHDFNNLLVTISGNAQRFLRDLPPDGPLRAAAADIQHAADRATSLTHQLLAFSRQQVFELKRVDMGKFLADARRSLEPLLGAGISVQFDVGADPLLVHADPAQLQTVLVSLAENARDAMAGQGGLTISTDAVGITEIPPERPWLRPGRYVRLVVSDTGVGMDAVARASAFHPFFTTKGLGNGRGLGLAMVYGIVKQSHGFVWIDSQQGEGARFTLLFPAVENRRGADTPPANPRNEMILLIEPDDGLRGMMCEALCSRGYRVVDCASAEDGLRGFASNAGRIDLIVLAESCNDGLDGPLVARLRAVNPTIQCLVTVGRPPSEPARVLPTTPTLGKPFTLKVFADRVRGVLDSGEGRS